eukprot:7048396-Alexandrium_andersonii.AAC.1
MTGRARALTSRHVCSSRACAPLYWSTRPSLESAPAPWSSAPPPALAPLPSVGPLKNGTPVTARSVSEAWYPEPASLAAWGPGSACSDSASRCC